MLGTFDDEPELKSFFAGTGTEKKYSPPPFVGFFGRQVSLLLMKIAVINTGPGGGADAGSAQVFLPELLKGLTGKGSEVHLIAKTAPAEKVFAQPGESAPLLHIGLLNLDGAIEETAPAAARWLGEINPDVYLIWNADAVGWAVLPLLNPGIATLAVGHADSEIYYAPARHYRSFLTRVIGTTPEVCVGFVLGCVIDKERVEWISYDEQPAGEAVAAGSGENVQKAIENFEICFEKALAEAAAAPRETIADFPPMKPPRPASKSWFEKLKARIMN